MHGGRSLAAETGKNHLNAKVFDDYPPEALASVSVGECKWCKIFVCFGLSLQSVNAGTQGGEKHACSPPRHPKSG